MDPLTNALVIIAVVSAAVFDIRTRKIPNVLTFSLILLSFFYYSIEYGLRVTFISLCGFATGLGLFLIPFLMGWMGAGDTKLLAAIGAAVGPKAVFSIFLITTLTGGVLVIIWLLYQILRSKKIIYGLHAGLYNFSYYADLKSLLYTPSGEKFKICYGVAIAIGTILFITLDIKNIDVLQIFT
jgi:prepilin peptidase CpaA